MSNGEPMRLAAPLTPEAISLLRAGDRVLLGGVIYTARDAAHRRLCELLAANRPFPVDLRAQVIYYVGPTPAPPRHVIGAAGPTTASRMDPYTPALLEYGIGAMIGKGMRSSAVVEAIVRHRSTYLAAIAGAGALMSTCIQDANIAAFEDLGPEAIFRLTVRNMPLIVINDCLGGDLYRSAPREWQRRGT
jgi:fumarate hydratase subunit beta